MTNIGTNVKLNENVSDAFSFNASNALESNELDILTESRGERYPDDAISSAAVHAIEIVVQVGILPVLTLCGVIMNVMNMVVFRRQGLRDRINLCLFSLALADSGYLTFILVTRFHSILSLVNPAIGQYWRVQSLSLVGIYSGFLNASNCLVLLISVERCFCVLWPLKAKTLLSVRFTGTMIVILFLLCMAGCSLSCFIYTAAPYNDTLTNTVLYRPKPTSFFIHHRHLFDAIFETTFNITVPTLSLSVVMVATLAIALSMRATLAWRRASTSNTTSSSTEGKEMAVTRMLIVVCAMYTICMTPYVLRAMAILLVPEFKPAGRFNNTFYVAISLTHLMAATNSSLNFVIYYVMSTRYRCTWREVVGVRLGGWGRRKENPPKSLVCKGELTLSTISS